MARHFVVKYSARAGAHGPDTLTLRDDGRVTCFRTGLVTRRFESLDEALEAYGLATGDLGEVVSTVRFSERHQRKIA